MNVYWLEQTEGDVPSTEGWLGSNEILLLDRMRFAKRRSDWRLGRWTAKRAVATCLNFADGPAHLAGVEILPAPSGIPQVWIAKQLASVTISISHSSGKAVCAVAPRRAALGCDLELIEPRSERFVFDYFATEERDIILRVPPKDQPLVVALLWSAKESALKALGVGLRLDTRCVVVSLVGDSQLSAENGESRSSDRKDQVELYRTNPWQPLKAACADGQRFSGWWQRTGDFVRTVIAEPAPASPIPVLQTIGRPPAFA